MRSATKTLCLSYPLLSFPFPLLSFPFPSLSPPPFALPFLFFPFPSRRTSAASSRHGSPTTRTTTATTPVLALTPQSGSAKQTQAALRAPSVIRTLHCTPQPRPAVGDAFKTLERSTPRESTAKRAKTARNGRKQHDILPYAGPGRQPMLRLPRKASARTGTASTCTSIATTRTATVTYPLQSLFRYIC